MNVSTVRTRDWSLSGRLDGRLAGETLFCFEFKFELAGHTVPPSSRRAADDRALARSYVAERIASERIQRAGA
jgi:hypothetical protein